MKIFHVSVKNTGCSKWRAEIPARYLERRGHDVRFLNEVGSNLECPDVVVFSRQYRHDLFRLFDWAKNRGIRVVYDTDDAFDLVDPWNPAFAFSKKHQSESEYMVKHADVVTTTTPELADNLRKHNPNVVVIPNSIDPEEWNAHPRDAGTRLRIGWLGGSSHFLDLAIAADALTELRRTIDFEFVVYGLTALPGIEELYRGNLEKNGEKFRNSHLGKAIKVFLRKTERLPYRFQPFVPVQQYASTLCDLRFDIGIAPLADTPFNRNKSSIKFYEYALSGAVTLASNVLPYSREVPCVADNNRESWKRKIVELASADRAALLRDQREWILSNRNIESTVVRWEEVMVGAAVLA